MLSFSVRLLLSELFLLLSVRLPVIFNLVTIASFEPPLTGNEADFGRFTPEFARDTRSIRAEEHLVRVGLVGVGEGVRGGTPFNFRDAALEARIIGEEGAGVEIRGEALGGDGV